ncbi:hypothetical protein JOF53_000044 [Crossiella equi]|uniref:Uncharacterized protein n=1 Tax=Crossiella equi TaxID=130796 RepID=A0ABS5A3L8_9PSEU|nr:hypothetical protein [Crossiella equi]MBP2471172.1 hypothetical protein [Crossiella equi]
MHVIANVGMLVTNGVLAAAMFITNYAGLLVLAASCAVLGQLDLLAARRAAAKVAAERV